MYYVLFMDHPCIHQTKIQSENLMGVKTEWSDTIDQLGNLFPISSFYSLL